MREFRYLKARELRTEKTDDGKEYLTGYAANYNVLSEDLGGWRERIAPGAFARAIRESQNVFHLINHDSRLVLGSTAAGTTELSEDGKGLRFRTLVGNRSYERDLIETMARGELNECSFAFSVHGSDGQKWDGDVRELRDLDLFDVSILAYPAYPGTSAGVDKRGMFPEGIPTEIRSRQGKPVEIEAEAATNRERFNLLKPAADGPKPSFRASVKSDGTLELLCYDDIGANWYDGSGVTAKGVKGQLDAAGAYSRISLRINSPGGDAFEGVAIYNLLRAQGKPIECCVDGLAASAASIVAMCGDTIVMGANAMMMIHKAWYVCIGNADEMRKTADMMDRLDASLARTYVDRTGNTMEDILAMMAEETWMGADECLDKGFCTAISTVATEEEEEEMAATARASRSVRLYRNLPDKLREQRGKKKMKRVDGEELTADCFLFAADTDDVSMWRLPWKFSTTEQTRTHLVNSLMRFNEVTWGALKPSKEDEKAAWNALVIKSKEHGIDVSQGKIRERLTPQQMLDFTCDDIAAQAQAKIRAIQASL